MDINPPRANKIVLFIKQKKGERKGRDVHGKVKVNSKGNNVMSGETNLICSFVVNININIRKVQGWSII